MVLSSLAHVRSSFAGTRPMLSMSCFYAGFHSDPSPCRQPHQAWLRYFGGSTVVTCMRAGLYQTKNGLLVFFGSLQVEEVDHLGRNFLIYRLFDRSSVSGPSSLHIWFLLVPSEDLQDNMLPAVA